MDVTRLVAVIMFYCLIKRTTALPVGPLDNDESDEDDTAPTTLNHMGENLEKIPKGRFNVTSANFAYNHIEMLPPYVFYASFYKNLQTLELGHNKIANVNVEAFKGMRQLKTVDLSNNNVTFLEPSTFRHNHKLLKLDLAFNNISFDPEKPFLRSHSIETLVLSNNHIVHIYDITFARLQNLRTLLLDNNPLYYLSSNCFVHLRHLQYVALANTGVYRLSNDMFGTVPRLVDLTGTALARKFEPPLRMVKNTQLIKLMDVEGDDYDT